MKGYETAVAKMLWHEICSVEEGLLPSVGFFQIDPFHLNITPLTVS